MSDRDIDLPLPRSAEKVFETLDNVRNKLLDVAKGTTEYYERQMAQAAFDLAEATADVVYLLREHLTYHSVEGGNHG